MLDFLVFHNQDIMFAVTFGCMLFMLLLEQIKPRRSKTALQTSRWLNNISITFLNYLLFAYITIEIATSSWIITIQPQTPLIHYLELNIYSAIFFTIIIMEFVSYWLHRLMHIIPLLWRVHAVHHCDTEVDVTTTHRHHPFEPFIALSITLPVLILFGPPILAIIIYNLLRVLITTISHSNIFIPKFIDRWLRYFIITPDFHRLHHASLLPYTDSNYGTVIPWFDYLFGSATKIPFKKHKTMELGLEYFRKPIQSRLDQLLLIPFRWK
jgi:sterol desaturase/sphingolipid hydroxylase (fatty acid hydroxylase superfamily)